MISVNDEFRTGADLAGKSALFLILTFTALGYGQTARATEIPFGPQEIISTSDGSGVDIIAGDLDRDGDLDLVASGGTNSPSGVYWYENLGAGSFSDSRVIDDSSGQLTNRASIKLVDMDADGDLDLLTGDFGNGFWYPNDGQGNFGARTVVRTDFAGFDDFAAADLDGDGDLDVIGVASIVTDKIAWYTNNGGGTFNPATENLIDLLVNGNGLGHVIPADLDGDGRMDLVATQSASGDNRVVWYRNTDGAGTFSAKLDVSNAPQFLGGIAVTDMDRDGDLDVVSVDYGFNAARWHENTSGDASAWTDHDIASSNSVSFHVEVADMDLDGDPDVLLGTRVANEARWIENTAGDGTSWTNRVVTGGVSWPVAAIAADLDRDGDPDVVTASLNDNKFAWSENRTIHRSAAYQAPITVNSALSNLRSVNAVDLDRDGDLDLVVPVRNDSEIVWFENDGGPPWLWPERQVGAVATSPDFATVADLDNDGDLDVVSAAAADHIPWFESDGGSPPLFTARTIAGTTLGGGPAIESGDIDGDGDIDLLANAVFGIAWYENVGGSPAGFTEHIMPSLVNNARDVDLADLDGDGDLDGISAGVAGTTVSWYENDGAASPTFTARAVTSIAGVLRAHAADMDGDGDQDIAVCAAGDGGQYWMENEGGTPIVWTPHLVATPSPFPQALFPGDLDGDGDMDLVSGVGGASAQEWYENNGADVPQWTIHPLPTPFAQPTTHGWDVADTDGDGDMDLISAAVFANTLYVYENKGGQYAVSNADSGNGAAPEGLPVPFLATTFTLRGRPGDPVGELETVDLRFTDTGGTPLTTTQAANLIDTLSLYRDDGSGEFEETQDFQIVSGVAPSLVAGVQSISLPGSDPNALLAAPATYFVVGYMADDAATQSPSQLRVNHLSGSSTVEHSGTTIGLVPEPVFDFQSQVIFTIPGFQVDSTLDAVDANPGDGFCATGGGQCTLRAAIQEANALAGDNQINLGAGTYTLSIPGKSDNVAATGDLDITGSGTTTTIVGAGAGLTIIDGADLDRVFHVQGNSVAVFRGLTVTGGDFPTSGTISWGGGIFFDQSAGVVRECDIIANSAERGGGLGVFAFAGEVIDVVDSVFRENTGNSQGDAITLVGATLNATNCTVSDNHGSTLAAILADSGAGGVINLDSCTVTGNDQGLGVASNATMNVGNTIVAGNDIRDLRGVDSFTSQGHNLIGDVGTATGFVDAVNNDQVGGGGNPVLDAGLDALGDYGGSTLTHALQPASPAVDAGSCAGLATDQRGEPRPVDIAGTANVDDGCDVGAYEVQFGNTLAQLEVPVRWCGLRGAPSIEDPSLLSLGTTNDVMRRRHEVATDAIYGPQGNILFRSAANEIVEDYPLLDDPDCLEGPPGSFTCDRGNHGDVSINPEAAIFDEFEDLLAACRAAWFEQDPEITGITAIHINRFVDSSGSPLEILGLGGRAEEGDAAAQETAGRVMVVDNLYRQNLPGNPLSPPNPEDLIDRLLGHELGHSLSLRHGNGVDDDGDGTVDNDDDSAVGLPRFDGPNLMQYRAGTELTPAQMAQARAHATSTVPDVEVQPLADSVPNDTPVDPKNAKVLDFGFDKVLDLANARVLDFKNASVLDFKNAKVLDFANARVLDFKNASVLDFKNAKVLDFGMNFRGPLAGDKLRLHGTTGALPWPPALRPTTRYYFFLDVDRDDATGAYPRDKQIPGEEPRRFPGRNNFLKQPDVAIEAGVDLITMVELSTSCPAELCTDSSVVRVYDYNDGTGEYEEVVIPETVPEIVAVGVGLYLDNGGSAVDDDEIPAAITVQPEIPNSVLFATGWGFTTPGGGGDPVPDPLRMEMLTTIECAGNILNDDPASGDRDCQCLDCNDCPDYPGCTGTTGTPDTLVDSTILTDIASGELTFRPPVLPSCVVVPQFAAEGDAVTVYVTDLPTDVLGTVEVTHGESLLGTVSTATIAADGSVGIAATLPSGASGPVVLSAGIQEFAPRARCLVGVTPNRACVDSDGDGSCDAVDPDDDNDTVDDAGDGDSLNPRVCRDTDGDLCDDCASGTDDPANDGPDFDLDGLCDHGDPDDDNDGVPDGTDGAPKNPNACGDTDGDRCDDCVIAAAPSPGNDGPDADADGLCDFGDPDDDNDGTDDYEDCAVLDDTLRLVPDPVVGFSSGVRIFWDAAQFGTATTSDLVRGDLVSLPVGSGAETCLDDDTSTGFFDDTDEPVSSGDGFWYLIRAENACGASGYGDDSSGTGRTSVVCP